MEPIKFKALLLRKDSFNFQLASLAVVAEAAAGPGEEVEAGTAAEAEAEAAGKEAAVEAVTEEAAAVAATVVEEAPSKSSKSSFPVMEEAEEAADTVVVAAAEVGRLVEAAAAGKPVRSLIYIRIYIYINISNNSFLFIVFGKYKLESRFSFFVLFFNFFFVLRRWRRWWRMVVNCAYNVKLSKKPLATIIIILHHIIFNPTPCIYR